jgi:hypothetical protein
LKYKQITHTHQPYSPTKIPLTPHPKLPYL